jgi:penicillin amidase
MRAAASDLCDVSDLPPEKICERRETIRVRGWFDRTIAVRETPWGPILSDTPQLKTLGGPSFALRWTGHQPSDEITAMLGVNRARNFAAFRDAFKSFAVPGQNMLYADHLGNIGQVMAAKIPDRGGSRPSDIIVNPIDQEAAWTRMLNPKDLPFSLNPPKGFLASANNRPADTETRVGYFFSPDDRVNRMAQILGDAGRVEVEGIKELQMDVHAESSVALRDLWLKGMANSGIEARARGKRREIVDLLSEWDGHYGAGSRGALAFELFRHAFTSEFYASTLGKSDGTVFAGVGRIKALLLEDIKRTDDKELSAVLRHSLAKAAGGLDRFRDWGDMHRLGLAHPLAFLKVIGKRFRFADHPAGGTTEALMKTAHRSTNKRHAATYGSNARHVSDLSDMDRNDFVLLGGQDGWINSSTFQDQVPLWRSGAYIQIPMRQHKMRARFRHKMELSP